MLFLAAPVIGQAGGSPKLVIKSATRLVEISVVVDGQSGPIGSLSKSDFSITDDGKVAQISFFEAAAATSARQLPALPEGQFNNAPAPVGPNVAIILLDCLNSTVRMSTGRPTAGTHGCSLGKQEIAKYLAQLGPNDKVALWGLNARQLVVLSDFSGDRSQLIAALSGFKTSDDPTAAAPLDDYETASEANGDFANLVLNFNGWIAGQQHHSQADFTKVALRAIANHLAQIPGRISLVWVTAIPHIPATEIVAALGNERIAVYPVDDRELFTGGENIPYDRNPMAGARDDLRSIADLTGGTAFLSRNDLAAGIRQAINDSSRSYTLGFYIGSQALDNKLHTLGVSVRGKGLKVRYPRGYWALADGHAQDAVNPVVAAIASPTDAAAIPLSATVVRNGSAGLRVSGTVGISNVQLVQAGELHEGSLLLALVGQSSAGATLQHMSNTLHLQLTAEQYADAVHHGLPFHQSLVLAPGVATIRILAEDLSNGAVGTLIVPLSAVH